MVNNSHNKDKGYKLTEYYHRRTVATSKKNDYQNQEIHSRKETVEERI